MIVGGFLCSIGMIAASFCNSVLQLYICIGVIGGEWILITYSNNYAKYIRVFVSFEQQYANNNSSSNNSGKTRQIR